MALPSQSSESCRSRTRTASLSSNPVLVLHWLEHRHATGQAPGSQLLGELLTAVPGIATCGRAYFQHWIDAAVMDPLPRLPISKLSQPPDGNLRS